MIVSCRQRCACHERDTEQGFTLVELMVSLFIFGMIAAAGVSLLTFSVRAQSAASARMDTMAQDQRLSAILGADLSQALPRVARDTSGAPVRAFEGTDGKRDGVVMSYIRGGWSNPDEAPRPGIQRVDIVLENARLERRAYPMIDGSTPANATILADNVEAITLRYREKIEWRNSWNLGSMSLLPRAVELTVKRKGRPALLMAFLVGAPYP